MTDIGIIFSGPMVRALIADRKTMTRRLAWRIIDPDKPVPKHAAIKQIGSKVHGVVPTPWQRVKVGDRLWCRENMKIGKETLIYAVDGITVPKGSFTWQDWMYVYGKGGVPSIHMPRWASRLTLIVTATRIHNLRSMSDADIMAEGVCAFKSGPTNMFGIKVEGGYSHQGLTPRETFANLWCDLHGPTGPAAWNDDPEVVALTFRVIKANIDSEEAKVAA